MTPMLPAHPVSRPLEKIDHGTRRQIVVEALLTETLQGTLRAGQRLVIKDLSDRFQVSSTPIREALIQLQAIGFIDFIPNAGAVVRRVTKVDVKEICQVRKALECEATRHACGRIELKKLHTLADAFRQMLRARRKGAAFVDRARDFDSQLHDLISESCGNRFLANEIGRLKLLFRAFRDASWEQRVAHNDFYRFEEEAEEHLAIVESLIAGDGKESARAMARHIRAGVKYWSRGLPD